MRNRFVLALGWVGFGLITAVETLIFGPLWSRLTMNWIKRQQGGEAGRLLPQGMLDLQHWNN